MTTQYAVFSGLPTGLTLTKKVFTVADPDTEVTGITGAVTERANAKGQYTVAVTKSAVITGIHTIILFVGSTPIAIGKRTFAGTDAETAVETPVTAVLDSASIMAIYNTMPDAGFTDGSFGDRFLISSGNQRTVAVTGSNHVAADVHNCQPDGLTDSTEIAAINTFATRVTTGIVQDGAVWQFTENMLELGPSGGGGGDATLANQVEIKALLTGTPVIQVVSPNVSGNLVLTQGDDYDGTANPQAQWTVTTDYTSGWTVALTIRDADDAVVYTTSGTVVSATVIAVTIAAPTGLTMTGCPGQWQGKFDVQLTHTATGKKKTIALGVCYINEDQTR